MMIAAVIGTTTSPSDGAATLTPSTAESTEIAGVIMLSPRNSEFAKDSQAHQHPFGPLPASQRPADQRDQRHDAALAVVSARMTSPT